VKHSSKAELVAGAITGGIEVSVASLIETISPGLEYPLEGLVGLANFLKEFEFQLSPSLHEDSDLAKLRILRGQKKIGSSVSSIVKDLASGESKFVEFKSSLFYDYRRAEKDPGASIDELKSEGVTEAALKTIAGFLNGDGGVLYLGVNDSGIPIGLDPDIPYHKHRNIDGWLLSLTTLIGDRFKDGPSVQGYVDPEICLVEEKRICKVTVSRRSTPSFLKVNTVRRYCLFARRGAETQEIGIEYFEEFLKSR
jgi:hypothetical protein